MIIEEIEKNFKDALLELIQDPSSGVRDADLNSDWSSLTQALIILFIEEKLDIEFSEDEIPFITNIDDLLNKVIEVSQ